MQITRNRNLTVCGSSYLATTENRSPAPILRDGNRHCYHRHRRLLTRSSSRGDGRRRHSVPVIKTYVILKAEKVLNLSQSRPRFLA